MNIYLVSQNENTAYNTFDAFVCYAESKEQARNMLPSIFIDWENTLDYWVPSPNKVKVTYLGIGKDGAETGVIIASYNAG